MFKPLIITLLAGLGGCAIHPLTEDVTAIDTNQVVTYIRCEARDAILTAIGSYLSRYKDPGSAEVSARILTPNTTFELPDLKSVDPKAFRKIEKYLPAAIAYDFTFDITEDNDIGTQFDFLGSFTHGALGLLMKADVDRQRQSVRNFRITDTFGGLLEKQFHQICYGPQPGPNSLYPITGTVGIGEVVKTFVDLNEFESLSPEKDSKDKAPVLADQFNFTTNISGSVAPKITLAGLRKGFSLVDASFTGAGSRKDVHKLIVALSLQPKPTATISPHSTARPLGASIGTANSPFGKTPAEQIAITEIYDQISRNILTNIVVR